MNKFIMCIVPQSYLYETFCRPPAPGLGNCPPLLYCSSQLPTLPRSFSGGVPSDISEQTLVQVCSFVYMMSFWCFDISIQGDQDVIDLLSKYGQDKTSRGSFYYKICNTGGSRRMRVMRLNKSALFEFYP